MNHFADLPNRITRIHAATFAGIALAVLALAGCGRPAKPVARIESAWIGQPQWRAYCESHAGQKPAEALVGLVRREVAWEDARKRGLLQGEDWEAFLVKSRDAILGKAYLAAQPGPAPFTEDQARTHFFSMGEERHVFHVLCRTQKQCETILRKIKLGMAFEQAAVAYSTDPSVAKNHGDLGWIKRAEVVKPFGDEVFMAPVGSVCGPFQTEFGWHLAQVLAQRTPTEADFQKNRARIFREMADLNEDIRRGPALKALRAEYPLVPDNGVLGLDRTTVLAPGDESRVAGRVGPTAISLKALKSFMGEYLKVAGQSHGLGPETKRRFLDLLGDDARLALAAEKSGIAKNPDVQAGVWDVQHQRGYDLFSRAYLAGYQVPEASLKAHYDRYPERFRGTGSLRLLLLVADESVDIDRAAADAMKGVPWSRLFAKYANRIATGSYDAGWVEVAKLQKVLPAQAVDVLVEKPDGTLIGPVPGPDGFMLLKALERRPGAVMPLQSCRDAVQRDYLLKHGEEIVDGYLDGKGREGLAIRTFPGNATLSGK